MRIKKRYLDRGDIYMNTPLHYANNLENTEFIEFLIKKCHCSIDACNRDGFKAKTFT